MRKSCCLADADVRPRSSRSMVLRSACSHKHLSPISPTVSEERIRESTPKLRNEVVEINRKESKIITSETLLHIGAALESSIKELALKSDQICNLKKNIYHSLELSQNGNYKAYQSRLLNASCTKELHYSGISLSSESSLNESPQVKEQCSDYSSGSESDLNHTTSKMSRTEWSHRAALQRSTASSVRNISGSESEGESSLTESHLGDRRLNSSISSRLRSAASGHISSSALGISTHGISSSVSASRIMSSSHLTSSSNNLDSLSERTPTNQRSFFSESPQLDVQYSFLDRFRWFLWRCIYLKIIKSINFDVWCLSRLHNFGKTKAIIILLLPLILLLLWGLHEEKKHTCLRPFIGALGSASSIPVYLSSVFSVLPSNMIQDEAKSKGLTDVNMSGNFKFLSLFHSLYAMFFGDGSHSEDSSPESLSLPPPVQPPNPVGKEEMRSLMVEVLKEEVSHLLDNFQKAEKLGRNVRREEMEKKFQIEMAKLRLDIKSLTETISKLEKDVNAKLERNANSDTLSNVVAEHKRHFDFVNGKLKDMEIKLAALGDVKKCCDQKWSLEQFVSILESILPAALKSVVETESSSSSNYQFFHNWLNSKFVDRESLTKEINIAFEKFKLENPSEGFNPNAAEKMIVAIVQRYMDTFKRNLTLSSVSGSFSSTASSDLFPEENVRKIVREALMLYDADKTGKADYALESGGGSVIGTRCSEAYVEKSGKFRIFGLSLWSLSNSPRTAIQAGMQPGQCWAFKGSNGFLVLELSASIYPSGFSLEHIPISLSPSGSIDSAPKDFSVWGLSSETDNVGTFLGKYSYDADGEPLQYFPIQEFVEEPFQYMELKVLSNHGNLDYTCLYRFRVHGRRAL